MRDLFIASRVTALTVALTIATAGDSLAADVSGIRLAADDDRTRVVLDMNGPAEYKVFRLADPERLVVDLIGSTISAGAERPAGGGLVKGIRTGEPDDGRLRVVFDISGDATANAFTLDPSGQAGHRLVIDINAASGSSPQRAAEAAPKPARDVVVVIDPGHGGKDPGSIGRHGTQEKIVTLAIARKLANLINNETGMKAVLTREGDQYPTLRGRLRTARDAHADMFVSIHADAFKDARAHGSSVYVLSPGGASSAASRWLAERENAALLGGVSLGDKDDVLASVLFDLSQTATISSSLMAAQFILDEMRDVNRLHGDSVKQAGFLVLKSPDIPSVFIEAAFLSNPDEERRLIDPDHQQRLAEAVRDGVRSYFADNAPPGTLIAERSPEVPQRHVISSGDTLSEIAARYRVSVDALRQSNQIRGDRLRVGQVLQIPSI